MTDPRDVVLPPIDPLVAEQPTPIVGLRRAPTILIGEDFQPVSPTDMGLAWWVNDRHVCLVIDQTAFGGEAIWYPIERECARRLGAQLTAWAAAKVDGDP